MDNLAMSLPPEDDDEALSLLHDVARMLNNSLITVKLSPFSSPASSSRRNQDTHNPLAITPHIHAYLEGLLEGMSDGYIVIQVSDRHFHGFQRVNSYSLPGSDEQEQQQASTRKKQSRLIITPEVRRYLEDLLFDMAFGSVILLVSHRQLFGCQRLDSYRIPDELKANFESKQAKKQMYGRGRMDKG